VIVLSIMQGDVAKRRVPVSTELVLGRGDVDLVIDDREASRRHAAVRPADGGAEIEDLGSRNGTRVNGQVIGAATVLRHGDIVTIGDTQIAVEAAVDDVVEQTAAASTLPDTPQPFSAAQPAAPSDAPFSTPSAERRRVAPVTRRLTATVLTYGAVVATAVVLLVYFASAK
jgi:pSer/pThr/pTyr-binding forkhead associated (FHA) protein